MFWAKFFLPFIVLGQGSTLSLVEWFSYIHKVTAYFQYKYPQSFQNLEHLERKLHYLFEFKSKQIQSCLSFLVWMFSLFEPVL